MLRKGTIYMVPKPKLGGDSLSFLHPSSLGQTVLPSLHLLSLIWFYLLFEILLTYNNDLESDGFLFFIFKSRYDVGFARVWEYVFRKLFTLSL